MNLLEPHLPKAQYTAGNNIGITSSTCRHYTLINSIMCSDSYPIPILSLFFLYHPYIPSFLIQRIFHFLVIVSLHDQRHYHRPTALMRMRTGNQPRPSKPFAANKYSHATVVSFLIWRDFTRVSPCNYTSL